MYRFDGLVKYLGYDFYLDLVLQHTNKRIKINQIQCIYLVCIFIC